MYLNIYIFGYNSAHNTGCQKVCLSLYNEMTQCCYRSITIVPQMDRELQKMWPVSKNTQMK